MLLNTGSLPASAYDPTALSNPQQNINSIHPLILLLDIEKQPVIDSGLPISTRASCGECHDYDFISKGFHSQQGRTEILENNNTIGVFPHLVSPGMYGKWCSMPNRQLTPADNKQKEEFDFGTPDWLRSCGTCHVGGGIGEFDRKGRKYNEVEVRSLSNLDPDYHLYSQKYDRVISWDWQESGLAEVDCFLCHIPNFNRIARDTQMREGYFSWALTATLLKTGIVKEDMGELVYNPEAFFPDKKVRPQFLKLGEPGVDNCGQCHGFAKTGKEAHLIDPFLSHELLRGTKKMGRIWSSAKIKDSNLNLKGKEALDFSWDIHAEKKMICTDCHFSPNNPAKNINSTWESAYLHYYPPTLKWLDFLLKPDHNIAKGDCYPETVVDDLDNSMRGCSDCHQASALHQWLPFREWHFKKLACEVCHIPKKYFWACQQIDLTIFPKGVSKYRGVIGDYKNAKAEVTGFQPAYFLKKTKKETSPQIVPCNPISALLWFDSEKGRPAFSHQVRRAFYQWDKRFQLQMRPEVSRFFDNNRDGKIDDKERRLDSLEKIEFAKTFIKQQGIKEPQLRLEITPFSVNHNIVSKGQAIKDCQECHSPKTRLLKEVEIFDYLPPGIDPHISEIVPKEFTKGPIAEYKDGKIFYKPTYLLSHFYIMGISRNPWVEWVGRLAVLLSLIGTFVHGLFRIMAHRK